MKEKVRDFLISEVTRFRGQSARTAPLLVAVEQEFFLLSNDGLPCTYEESQRLLREFAQEINFQIYSNSDGTISRVGRDRSDGSYSNLKYDHEPHLIEYASSPHSTLAGLAQELVEVFETLTLVTERLELQLEMIPVLPVSPEHPRTLRDSSAYQNLRLFRKLIQEKSKAIASPGSENYAAVIASTQVNISVRDWLWIDDPTLVANLYRFETKILPFATMFTGADHRWLRYNTVYRNYPLLGFPDLEEWTIENWIEKCLSSYVFDKNKTTLILLSELAKSLESHDLGPSFKETRDLQIIRPKVTGAVEFRADPSQPSVEHVLALCALRLGTYLLCKRRERDGAFRAHRTAWWKSVTTFQYGSPDIAFLDSVHRELQNTEPTAARYLDAYYKTLRSYGT